MARIIGGSGNDRLLGTGRADEIFGLNGNDTIEGRDGNDRIDAGDGADTVNAGEGSDIVFAGLGRDSVRGGEGADSLYGGGNEDTLEGGDGRDLLSGDDGNDSLLGGAGQDTVLGGIGADTLSGGLGADLLDGGDGTDVAFFAGRRSDYTIVTDANGVTTVTGRGVRSNEGADTLRQIEQIRFGDGTIVNLATPANRAPIAGADSATISEDGANVVINTRANDSDPDGDSLVISGINTAGTLGNVTLLNAATGQIQYTPGTAFQNLAAGQTATDTFTYSLSDGRGGLTQASVTITITGANDAPIVSGALTRAVTEDGAIATLDLLQGASDVDQGAVLGVTGLSALPAGLSLDADGRTLRIDPSNAAFQSLKAGQTQNVVLSYQVSDGAAQVAQTATIAISGVNDAPAISVEISDQTASEDTAFSFVVPANTFADVDGDTLSYAATLANGDGLPAWLTFDAATRTFSGTPAQSDVGVLNVRVTASDGALSVSDEFTLTIGATNDAPIITANGGGNTAAVSVSEGSTTVTTITSTDPDGPARTYSLSGDDAPLFQIDSATGALTFVSAPNFEAPTDVGGDNIYNVTVTLSDGAGGSDAQDLAVTVTNANEAPVQASTYSDFAVNENTGFSLVIEPGFPFSDPDGDALTYTATMANGDPLPQGITLVSNLGPPDYTPGTVRLGGFWGQPGTFDITLSVSDGNGGVIQTPLRFVVAPRNDAPIVANPIADQTAAEDSAFSFAIAANTFSDEEGDTLTYAATLANGDPLPAWLSFNAATRTFSGTPAQADVGTLSVRVTASDGALSASDVFDLTVSDTPEAANQWVYFAGRSPIALTGDELWRFDGTNLDFLAEISPGAAGSIPGAGGFLELDGKIYFTASDPTAGRELRVFDPVARTTSLVADINPGPSDSMMVQYGGLFALGGKIYFTAEDPTHGYELRHYDPSTGTVALVADIEPGSGSARPGQYSGFIALSGKLFFFANDSVNGVELRVHDPATGATSLVADIYAGPRSGGTSSFTGFAALNGKLYFSAFSFTTGAELWVHDPSTGSTNIVADYNPGSSGSIGGFSNDLVALGGKLYFSAALGQVDGFELRVYDPNTNTISRVADIWPGPQNSDPGRNTGLIEFEGKLYFDAWNGTNGYELHVFDPISGTVTQIADLNPGLGGSDIGVYSDIVAYNGKLYFTGYEPTAGYELRAYDPASGLISLVADISPGGTGWSFPGNLRVVNGLLIFTATDQQGRVNWYSYDGTDVTRVLMDPANPLTDLIPWLPSETITEATPAAEANLAFQAVATESVGNDVTDLPAAPSAVDDFVFQSNASRWNEVFAPTDVHAHGAVNNVRATIDTPTSTWDGVDGVLDGAALISVAPNPVVHDLILS